jgi:uncharacterized protein YeaO (DUF488 family)
MLIYNRKRFLQTPIWILIKTKYIYTPKETSDGIRILIARKWPRGIRKGHFDEWYKELSPEEDTLKK